MGAEAIEREKQSSQRRMRNDVPTPRKQRNIFASHAFLGGFVAAPLIFVDTRLEPVGARDIAHRNLHLSLRSLVQPCFATTPTTELCSGPWCSCLRWSRISTRILKPYRTSVG